MGAERRLDDGQHAMSRDAHEVRPRRQVVDHRLDGHNRAPPGGERTPGSLEHRRMQGDVAGTVRDGGVEERDVGGHRRQEPNAPELGVHLDIPVVRGHRGPRQRRPGCSAFQSL